MIVSRVFIASIFIAAASFGQVAATTITELFGFPCGLQQQIFVCPEGLAPVGRLIQASDGNFYGVAEQGGNAKTENVAGTVFKLSPAGQATALHTFLPGPNGTFPNGENPTGGVIEGADGFLYGTTTAGGPNKFGNIFKISKSGQFQVFYNFCSRANCADGGSPNGPLIIGKDGSFYGSTASTIFKITPRGAFSLIHTFNPNSEGLEPNSIIQGADGNFYGTAGAGPQDVSLALGTVFRVTPEGKLTTLHVFQYPEAPTAGPLVLASNGSIYGGTNENSIFEITPAGTFTEIANLTMMQGSGPRGLIQASDGNLWGVGQSGGDSNPGPGTVFAITPTGTFLQSTSLNCGTGSSPESIVQGTDGKLYGVAATCGVASNHEAAFGSVFRMDAGLPPPVK